MADITPLQNTVALSVASVTNVARSAFDGGDNASATAFWSLSQQWCSCWVFLYVQCSLLIPPALYINRSSDARAAFQLSRLSLRRRFAIVGCLSGVLRSSFSTSGENWTSGAFFALLHISPHAYGSEETGECELQSAPSPALSVRLGVRVTAGDSQRIAQAGLERYP